jgi:hypothetical protein
MELSDPTNQLQPIRRRKEGVCFGKTVEQNCLKAKEKREKQKKKLTTPAGLEPARENPNRFRVYRLNRSAKVSYDVWLLYYLMDKTLVLPEVSMPLRLASAEQDRIGFMKERDSVRIPTRGGVCC